MRSERPRSRRRERRFPTFRCTGSVSSRRRSWGAVDALANVSYTAANNPNRLPAYAVFNAGFAAPLRFGTLAIVASNLTNRFPGPFVSPGDVRTLPRSGLAPLALTAAPLGARAVSVTYTVRAGRLGATGSGAGSADAASASSGEREVSIVLNFRPLPSSSPGPEALRIDPDNENCTPIAARVAQPVLDALGVIRDVAERSKTASGYPAALRGAPSKVANVDLQYIPYDGNAHYAVAIGGSLLYSAAVINCAAIAFATPEEVVKRQLYVAPKQEKNGLFIAYSPLVGMYFVPPPQPPKGMTSKASTDPEPAKAPADPFARRTDCPAQSKPVADALVAAVAAARAAQAAGGAMPASDFVDITAHGTEPATWLELKARDAFAVTAAMQCLHVAEVPRDHLQAAGITDERRGSPLGFTERFGFYLIQRPVPPASSASPPPSAPPAAASTAPSASPSPAPH
jgi:hypothetical protein